MTVLYISGPMTGYEEFNIPTFNAVEKSLTKAGYFVLNPVKNWSGRTDLDRRLYMRLDLQQVMLADGLAMLPGWDLSRGARLESEVAAEIGVPVESYDWWLSKGAGL